MARDVHGERLVDATYSCYLTEIRIHTLIGDDGKKDTSFFTEWMSLVFFCDVSC